jgi:hypothetical protein
MRFNEMRKEAERKADIVWIPKEQADGMKD